MISKLKPGVLLVEEEEEEEEQKAKHQTSCIEWSTSAIKPGEKKELKHRFQHNLSTLLKSIVLPKNQKWKILKARMTYLDSCSWWNA